MLEQFTNPFVAHVSQLTYILYFWNGNKNINNIANTVPQNCHYIYTTFIFPLLRAFKF